MTSCLLDPTITRKNKITLTDYDYIKDIQNRILMAEFTQKDLLVLEEILYNPLQIPLEKLSKNVDIPKSELLLILEKLAPSGLFLLEKDSIMVDKETRKYFELQLPKFDEDFQPGMEFLQSLLKKPPIHVLPTWYALPKTSTHIFDSIIEKNLFTPQIFLRYIAELNFGEPVLKQIIQDVFTAENLELPSSFFMKKYNISKELFAEYMLHLEFSCVCCIGYHKKEDRFEEVVTPFYEWAEYLSFIKNSEINPIKETDKITLKRPNEFSFAEDLSLLLEKLKNEPFAVEIQNGLFLPEKSIVETLPFKEEKYIHTLLSKLLLVKLVSHTDGMFHLTKIAFDWLNLRSDDKCLYFYRHPLNRLINTDIPQELCREKTIKDTEKSITRILYKDWVFFDDFLKGVLVPLNGDSTISLKKSGKTWKYSLPNYSLEETNFLRAVILDWLFEAGITQVGSLDGKDCFRVTSLGQTLFAR